MAFDLKTLFKKKVGAAPKRGFRYVSSPRRDWTLLLIVFTVAIAALLFLNIRIFLEVNRGDFFVPVTGGDTGVERLDRSAIEAVIADFESKDRERAKLEGSKPVFPDPSN